MLPIELRIIIIAIDLNLIACYSHANLPRAELEVSDVVMVAMPNSEQIQL